MQAGILLSNLLILPIIALPQSDQVDPCLDNEATTLDGPTSDQSAGIGVEFETRQISFGSTGCSPSDTNQAKGQVVGNRKGNNWELTADTTNIAGILSTEYILDGTKIKVGDDTATAAAAAVSGDIVRADIFAHTSIHILIDPDRWPGIHLQTWKTMNGISTVIIAIHGKSRSLPKEAHRTLLLGRYR